MKPLRHANHRQTTLASSVSVSGIGVHSGEAAQIVLHPADAHHGIVFLRTGCDGHEREVRATFSAVTATSFATVLGDRTGPLVSTAEHILASLRGLGVDNALIEIDGPEVPIMDGSAVAFVDAIDRAGIVELAAPRQFIEVLKPVRATMGDAYGELRPHLGGFRAEIEIDFDNSLIGRQQMVLNITPTTFRTELARARTFGCMGDVTKLWSAGYARGASLENAVVYDETRVLNPEGLRFADEFVRHKMLDAVGDLALAGLPILGAYRSYRGGHKLNHAVLTALMSDRSAWRIVDAVTAAEPARSRASVRGHADVAAGLVAPAYGPDVS